MWVDRYRPRSLDDLDYHPELSDRLRALVRRCSTSLETLRADLVWLGMQAAGDFPHTLFYGPSGAGKKTRIMATLRELFGPGVEKVSKSPRVLPSRRRCVAVLVSRNTNHAATFVPQIRIEQRTFLTPSKRKLDVNIVQSNYHIEITPRCAV